MSRQSHHIHTHAIQVSQHRFHPPPGHHGHRASNPGKLLMKWAGACTDPIWRFRGGFVFSYISILILVQGYMAKIIPSPSCTNISFFPHTSVTFNVSGLYCDQLTIKKYVDNSPAPQWDTSLYLLLQMPNLSTVCNFTISDNVTLSANQFYNLSFYLHEGSSYTIKACKMNGTKSNDMQVCIIKGDKNLNNWIKTGSCDYSHFIKLCNSSSQVSVTFSETIKETNTYYFVYSTQNDTDVRVHVDMAFISLEYSVEQSNVYRECTLSAEDQSCTIDIPRHFAGAAVLATSAATDKPDVWKNTLPVSWECDPSMSSFEIYMYLPLAVPCVLMSLFFLSWLCTLRYCQSGHSKTIVRIWSVILVISTILAIPICQAFNVMWAQNVAAAFSWDCDPGEVDAYFGLSISCLLYTSDAADE